LERFIPANPETKPTEYEFEVKSYCILSHAALEEYFESVALAIMHESINLFYSKKLTYPLLAMLSYSNQRLTIDDNEDHAEKKSFDHMRELLEKFKEQFSIEVHNNNGISPKHLRKILTPMFVNIIEDPNIKNSLKQLSKERGSYSHKRQIPQIAPPEDVRVYVKDCLFLCKEIKEQAHKLFNE
jgi:hypothetical protein